MTRSRLAVPVVLALLCSACASLPSSGDVHLGRALPPAGGLADLDVRVFPPQPVAGMAPAEVVTGFLHALVNDDGNYAVARSYLTTAAARGWDARAGVTTYDEANLRVAQDGATATTRSVRVQAPRVGLIDPRGAYTPSAGSVDSSFTLARQGKEWRIDRLKAGVLLSALDAQRSYRLADVYYLNRAGTAVAPEQVLLRGVQRGVTTALVRTLLSGPGAWLAPAVRSAAPGGTELIGNVPVDASGTAEVNLSAAARQATGADLQGLSAQLVWTLRQVGQISAVRLLVEGSPVAVPGVSSRQPMSAWSAFDPYAGGSPATAVYAGPARLVAVGGSLPGLAAGGAGAYLSAAVSTDRHSLAAVRAGTGRQTLVAGPVKGPLTARVSAQSLTAPTFARQGDLLTVASGPRGRQVVDLGVGGPARKVDADDALLGQPVQQLRLSPDGSRVAAVVGLPGAGRLLVGRVIAGRALITLNGFRDVLPSATDVRGLAWVASDELAVTAASAAGHRQVVAVDVDGYSSRLLNTVDVTDPPVTVAAARGGALLLGGEHATVWAEGSTGWRRLGPGRAPAYPG